MQAQALRLAGWLTRITETVGALLMLAIVVMNCLQVFFRYVLFDPLGWTEEAMRYSVVWMTFLVAGAVLYGGEQLSIDMLGNVLPPKLRRLQSILILLLISVFCFVLVVYGWPQALRNMKQVSPVAQIPMIIPYMSVVFGGAMMLIKAICLLIADPERVHGTLGDGDAA
ncbi:MAG: TRAP transporter small permease [Rhodobiaceae bacterium]|nr:TRAP transporter small permease [Rhodobiaceae bacterium]